MKKLLLTSNRKYPKLEEFCKEKDFDLVQITFLEITFLKPKLNQEAHWLFFSSPNASAAYLQGNYQHNAKIACIGASTAKPFVLKGIQPDFIGDSSMGPDQIAKEFLELSATDEVLHLTSNLTSSVLNRNTISSIEEVEIYCTDVLEKEVPNFDAVIVTSPSNLKGLLQSTKLEGKLLIAQGPTTYKAMQQEGLENSTVSTTPNEEGWIKVLNKVEND